MKVAEPGFEPLQLFSSVGWSSGNGPASGGKDLLRVDYTRIQSNSPDYLSLYEGYDQIISVDVSTVIFRASPEPLVTLYDLLMTTFVPPSPSRGDAPSLAQGSSTVSQPTRESSSQTGKLRLLVTLASVEREDFVVTMNVHAKLLHSYSYKCGQPYCNPLTINRGCVSSTWQHNESARTAGKFITQR